MIQVAAAIIVDQTNVLIAKRGIHKTLAGYWEFPGGKIEVDETPEQCLVRELKEELDIKINVERFLTAHSHDYGSFRIVLNGYICRLESGIFKLVDHDEVEWVEAGDLLCYPLAPADIPLAAYYLKQGGFKLHPDLPLPQAPKVR